MGRLNFIRVKKIGVAGLALLLLIGATAQTVFSREDHDRAKILRERGEIRPLPEILEKAQKKHPGQIIEVEMEEEAGKIIYELEFLDEKGRVWELKYDAKSGDLLSTEQEE